MQSETKSAIASAALHAGVLGFALLTFSGAARDATLSRIARIAYRVRWFPLPRRANGLRQPVHVADLANAAVDCLPAHEAFDRAFDLPGGETLPYREMVRRVLRVLDAFGYAPRAFVPNAAMFPREA